MNVVCMETLRFVVNLVKRPVAVQLVGKCGDFADLIRCYVFQRKGFVINHLNIPDKI